MALPPPLLARRVHANRLPPSGKTAALASSEYHRTSASNRADLFFALADEEEEEEECLTMKPSISHYLCSRATVNRSLALQTTIKIITIPSKAMASGPMTMMRSHPSAPSRRTATHSAPFGNRCTRGGSPSTRGRRGTWPQPQGGSLQCRRLSLLTCTVEGPTPPLPLAPIGADICASAVAMSLRQRTNRLHSQLKTYDRARRAQQQHRLSSISTSRRSHSQQARPQ